jgi:hypothetical protein
MKPRTRRASLLLVLGVASTYVVAWVGDIRRPFGFANNAPHIPARWVRPVPSHWPPVESVHATQGRRPHFIFLCAYTATPDGPDPQVQHRQEHWRSGWPFLALQRTDTFDYSFTSKKPPGMDPPYFSIERGIGLPASVQTYTCKVLPVRPLWAGFLANTLLYAGAFGLVLFSPGAISRGRRERRRRRGECVRCRYEVRGLEVCPECGTPASH